MASFEMNSHTYGKITMTELWSYTNKSHHLRKTLHTHHRNFIIDFTPELYA